MGYECETCDGEPPAVSTYELKDGRVFCAWCLPAQGDVSSAQARPHLQQLLDECARQLRRAHDWKERTGADTGSLMYARKEGVFDTYLHHAHYLIGVANRAGLSLDETALDSALERGDFL